MSLPQFQSSDRDFQLMQNAWATQINPLLNAPLSNGQILKNVSLVAGSNSINHKLGRKLLGWFPVRVRAASVVYDTQDSNLTPNVTLSLNASAPVVVDIFVF